MKKNRFTLIVLSISFLFSCSMIGESGFELDGFNLNP
jgi:hypothetical protein